MNQPPVLIVGAGPTGLVLALWLTRLGVAVRIIDRLAEAGTTSRALAVQARTLEFYRQIRIADALIDGGVKIAGINLWVKGEKAARVPIQTFGEGLSPYPYPLVYPQDAHERLLIEQLAALGVTVERQTELVGFNQTTANIQATLRLPDGSEQTCETSYLAGCDGASSIVRETLAIDFPGGTYSGLFYVADVDAAGPATDDELHIELDDADFVIVFPLKGEGRVRLVGTVRAPAGRDNSELTFDDVGLRAIEQLKLDIKKVNWFSTYRVHHRVAHSFRTSRVFLLGDAAHIHSPVGGQGMNTGIGDAVNLAWKLAAVIKNEAAENLLDTYEPERIAFARRLVATTDRAFTLVTKQGTIARIVRTKIVPIVIPMLFRIPPLRKFFFRTVSQISINYRGGSLSKGRTGGLRGGDRLPWVQIAPGKDNFEPLASLNWQVHIYGEPPSAIAEICAGLNLPLHQFPWRSEMQKTGLQKSAIYLIRPDGYIALADSQTSAQALRQYFNERELRLG